MMPRWTWVLALVGVMASGCDGGSDDATAGDGAAGGGDRGLVGMDLGGGDSGGEGGGPGGAGGDGGSGGEGGAGGAGGEVGEPVEVEPCVEVVQLGDLEVFAYEASRSDADADNAGTDAATVCSRPGVLPWTGIAWPDASRVCLAAGFRLCSNEEWQRACQGERLWHFPYAMHHAPGTCNDHVSGSGAMEPTGTHADCRTPEGAYDMSGNAWELTMDGARRGASWKINAVMFRPDSARCDMFFDVSDGFADDDVSFRCCR